MAPRFRVSVRIRLGCWETSPGGPFWISDADREKTRLLLAVRKLIPYRAPDVSPFERPLTTPELERFGGPFRLTNLRRFRLPLVSLVQIAPVLCRWINAACRLDGWLLAWFPRLGRLSSVTVFEITKS
jgi:hypothetical protein